jgi:hypothetical protein
VERSDENPRHVLLEFDSGILDGVPDVPAELLRTVPFIVGGENDAELRNIEKGRCPVCTSQLGEETAVFVGMEGIIWVVCRPLCLDDQVVMGYLNQLATDIVQTVQFRGNESNGEVE